MAYEVAVIRRGNTLPHSRAKPLVFAKQAQCRILHKLCGIRAAIMRYPREFCFLFGRKSHIHLVEPRNLSPACQRWLRYTGQKIGQDCMTSPNFFLLHDKGRNKFVPAFVLTDCLIRRRYVR